MDVTLNVDPKDCSRVLTEINQEQFKEYLDKVIRYIPNYDLPETKDKLYYE